MAGAKSAESASGVMYSSSRTSSIGYRPPMIQPPKIRKIFPETWIWDEISDTG